MQQINEKVNTFQIAAVRRLIGLPPLTDDEIQHVYRALLNYAEFGTPVKVHLVMRRVKDLKPGHLIVGRVGGAVKRVLAVEDTAEYTEKMRIDFELSHPNFARGSHEFRHPNFYYLCIKDTPDHFVHPRKHPGGLDVFRKYEIRFNSEDQTF